MLEKMKSAWRIPELRKKIIYTFAADSRNSKYRDSHRLELFL